jgi:hypothetical protein
MAVTVNVGDLRSERCAVRKSGAKPFMRLTLGQGNQPRKFRRRGEPAPDHEREAASAWSERGTLTSLRIEQIC